MENEPILPEMRCSIVPDEVVRGGLLFQAPSELQMLRRRHIGPRKTRGQQAVQAKHHFVVLTHFNGSIF